MFDELYHHRFAYTLLVALLTVHIFFYFLVWPDRFMLRILSASLAVSYFSWGVMTHVKANHITKQIVKEYLYAALLAGSMLFLLTL